MRLASIFRGVVAAMLAAAPALADAAPLRAGAAMPPRGAAMPGGAAVPRAPTPAESSLALLGAPIALFTLLFASVAVVVGGIGLPNRLRMIFN